MVSVLYSSTIVLHSANSCVALAAARIGRDFQQINPVKVDPSLVFEHYADATSSGSMYFQSTFFFLSMDLMPPITCRNSILHRRLFAFFMSRLYASRMENSIFLQLVLNLY